MYSMVLLMALSNGTATADRPDGYTDRARFGNHLRHEEYRHRHGCCGGGGYGSCYGGYGGCYGGGGYGGGYYRAPYRSAPYAPPPPPPPPATRRGAMYDAGYDGAYVYTPNRPRGLLGRRRVAYDYGPQLAGGYYGPSPTMTPGSYQSFYAGPRGEAAAVMVVRLPADAQLTVNDNPTRSTGSPRLFITPPLPPGKEHSYQLKASMMRDGKEVTETKEVKVRAGQKTPVTIGNQGRDMDRDRGRSPQRDQKPHHEEP